MKKNDVCRTFLQEASALLSLVLFLVMIMTLVASQ